MRPALAAALSVLVVSSLGCMGMEAAPEDITTLPDLPPSVAGDADPEADVDDMGGATDAHDPLTRPADPDVVRSDMVLRTMEVSDGLDKAAVQEVMVRQAARFQYCYERELVRDPTLAGTVVAAFTIEVDGTVRQVDVSEHTLATDGVADCIRNGLLHAHFPTSRRPVTVRYPLEFRSSQ